MLAANAAAQTSDIVPTSTREESSSNVATATGPNTGIASATGTGDPCAQVSSLLAACM